MLSKDSHLGEFGVTDKDSDSCGLKDRGASFLGLYSAQGFKNLPYSGIAGIDQDTDLKDCRWFEINFRMATAWEGRRIEADFVARVTGQRLESLVRQIRISSRATLRPSGKTEAPHPQVDSIIIEAVALEPLMVDD